MKNIHILPTDKPSRLYFYKGNNEYPPQYGLRSLKSLPFNDSIANQNIYITNDEEIKIGTWAMSLCNDESYEEIYQCKKANLVPIEDRKIILTTDQDLIKDGVQSIDEEFLEWFVKNPSCEEVEVNKLLVGKDIPKINFAYKIIIPKEEETKCYCGHTTYCDCGPEETKQECMITKIMQMDAEMAYDSLPKQDKIMERFIANAKQETLEEAAITYAHKSFIWPLNKQGEKQSIPPGQLIPPGYTKHQKIATKHFRNGAKWQQERMYSELELFIDEVKDKIDSFEYSVNQHSYIPDYITEWFEQFKKK